MKYYAGIGSRKTPKHIQIKMTAIAHRLNSMGYCLRSGGAEGADQAFESGAKTKQILLPWEGFNGKYTDSSQYIIPSLNLDFVYKYHPIPSRLTTKGLKLMSRNSNQVLGSMLDEPAEFVLCWTEGGKKKGGTAQAIRIAEDYRIPVFNFGSINGLSLFAEYILAVSRLPT